MAGWVLDVISFADNAARIDQVRIPLRKVCVGVVRRTNYFVSATNFFAHIGKQRIPKTLGFLERFVVCWGIKRGAENDAVGGFERLGTVTQALALNRSTGCRSFGIPPQKNPLAGLIGQAHSGSILIRQRKSRCRCTCLQHRCVLSREPQNRGSYNETYLVTRTSFGSGRTGRRLPRRSIDCWCRGLLRDWWAPHMGNRCR
jgi:hypothetical protein